MSPSTETQLRLYQGGMVSNLMEEMGIVEGEVEVLNPVMVGLTEKMENVMEEGMELGRTFQHIILTILNLVPAREGAITQDQDIIGVVVGEAF